MEEQIVLILSQLLERKINVREEVSANTEANWDSMKHIEIIMTLEEEFGISFAPEDIPQLKSLSKIIEKVKELKC